MQLLGIPHVNFERNKILVDTKYNYQLLTDRYKDQVIDVFTDSFCHFEPMTEYLKMDTTLYKVFAKAVTEKAIEDGLSVVALDGNKVIACALVEDLMDPGPIPDFDPKFEYILAVLEKLGHSFFSNKIFPKGLISHLFITAVDRQYRHQGLSTQINFNAMDVSLAKGFGFVYCELTHYYNELGIMHHLRNAKKQIGHVTYDDFEYKGVRPFANLSGSANSYLWEINPKSRLFYKSEDKTLLEFI